MALELVGVHKSYGRGGHRVDAVRGVDLSVGVGEVVALLGHNGAGKSVTLDIVLGLQTPDSGSVTIAGRDPRSAVSSGTLGGVLQTGALLDDLTVGETVRAVGSLHGVGRGDADAALRRAGLSDLARRKVSKCSGGERQRLRFALALLPDPDLLILDEPTTGMDVTAREEFWATIDEDARAGRTIVFATHYLAEAEQFAPRTVLMAGGRIIADDTTEAVRAQVPGRTLRCQVDTAVVHATLAAARGLPEVQWAQDLGEGRLDIRATATDDLALMALRDWGAREVEVTRLSLDEAFTQLTREAAQADREVVQTNEEQR